MRLRHLEVPRVQYLHFPSLTRKRQTEICVGRTTSKETKCFNFFSSYFISLPPLFLFSSSLLILSPYPHLSAYTHIPYVQPLKLVISADGRRCCFHPKLSTVQTLLLSPLAISTLTPARTKTKSILNPQPPLSYPPCVNAGGPGLTSISVKQQKILSLDPNLRRRL